MWKRTVSSGSDVIYVNKQGTPTEHRTESITKTVYFQPEPALRFFYWLADVKKRLKQKLKGTT